MSPEDLLYNYAKHYLHHNVKATLLYENWFGRTVDVKDTKFMQEYIAFRDYVNDNKFSETKIKKELKFLKQHRIGYIYEKLYESMIELLEKTGKITDNEKKSIELRLEVYRSLEYVNFQYINEQRKIEEEMY
jgi:hypothetical protein